MKQLGSYLLGDWQPGAGDDITLLNPTTEGAVVTLKRATDLDKATTYGRDVGGASLRAMSFAERGEMLGSMSKLIYEHREELIGLAIENGGNTRGEYPLRKRRVRRSGIHGGQERTHHSHHPTVSP